MSQPQLLLDLRFRIGTGTIFPGTNFYVCVTRTDIAIPLNVHENM